MIFYPRQFTILALLALQSLLSESRVAVIGDLHGDITSTMELLRLAQVIDCSGKWVTGSDVVIQMGDALDRGPHGHEILELFEGLKVDAAANGGEFIQLLGNHELMNLQGDFKFVPPTALHAFGGISDYRNAFLPSGLYGSVIGELSIAVIRNESLFVHGGLHPSFAKKTIESLNVEMKTMIHTQNFSNNPLSGILSPVWTRELIHSAQKGDCKLTHESLRIVSDNEVRHGRRAVKRMIVGHTIQPNGAMMSYCNGSFIAVDICVSQFMGTACGWLGFLEVKSLRSDSTFVTTVYPSVRRRVFSVQPVKKPKWVPMVKTTQSPASLYIDALLLFSLIASAVIFFVRRDVLQRRREALRKKDDASTL